VKRLLASAAVIVSILAAVTVVLLPRPAPPPVSQAFHPSWPVVRGAYHVHSQRSDGTGTLDEIAAAAAAAGLQFVIVTDHGDGTREPLAPVYRGNVLFLDGVEISTEFGHYVALGLPRAPYPLAGHPREVIEDVHRLGGFGFAAHPGSPKGELRWTDWDAPFDGLEWLNADSEWRDEFWGSLGGVLLTYAFRPTETLAGLLDRPEAVLKEWDRLAMTRRVPALAGADAHARLGFGQQRDPYENRVVARVPGYGVSFRAFVNNVVLDRSFDGDPTTDAAALMAAIRAGRMFTSIDGAAGLGWFEAAATSGNAIARLGEYLDLAGPAAIVARIAAPPDTTLVVLKDGVPLYDAKANEIRVDIGDQAGVYRVEARLSPQARASSVPWVLSNPIYVGFRAAHAAAAQPAALPPVTQRVGFATTEWLPEASAGSTSALTADVLEGGLPALRWQFSLSGGAKAQQYSALRFPVGKGLAGEDRIQLRMRSDAPRRVWAQIRTGGDNAGERWGRTFYVDNTLTPLDLRFTDFRPLMKSSPEHPPLDRIDSVLLVIDTLNNRPGSSGTLWIPDLWLAK